MVENELSVNKNYPQQVEKLLKERNIKEYDYSQCENRKLIGHGGFSLVYSIVYHGTQYALKCLSSNMSYDDNPIKLLKREFCLNNGGKFTEQGFVLGTGAILGDNGNLKKEKISQSIPIIYLPKKNGVEAVHNNVQIHIPILTLHYQCDATSEFVQDIRNVLEISDTTKKSQTLKEKFNYYGEYVVISTIVGGIITIENWSEIDDVSRSRLKAYLQWSIDCAKGIRLKNFEDASIDDLNLQISSKNVHNAEDLYKWIKDLHNYKGLEIISFEKFKSIYQLLPEDLVQQIPEYFDIKHIDKFYPMQDTKFRFYEKIKVSEWIASPELPLKLYICDWIQDNSLQYGIILQRSKPGRAKKAAVKFLKEPEMTQINKITIILTQPKTRQEAYLLDNGIILKNEDGLELDEIPFAEHNSILNIPLEDFKNSKKQLSNAIYCQIIFHTVKISFGLSDIEYLHEFLNAVKSKLQDHESSKNLCKLFGDDYGHFLPRTFTLGGVLSKKYISNNHPIDFPTQQSDIKFNDPYAHQKIEQLLETWNKEFKDINTLYFLDNMGDVVYRNNIGDWMKSLAAKPKNWNIVFSEDWVQIYKVFKKKGKYTDASRT
ncbi:31039_t:CDS:2 [Gigaspora margarita]|uniref:31039_t:CDS:1 n=1 Tax=Gigaspora margarita TaxID=4874 RepID=A0ABN7V6A8_GIGMA|nr:31039_t:CDS:2 [Gigaspora margarita]